jgi:hypothetical protein
MASGPAGRPGMHARARPAYRACGLRESNRHSVSIKNRPNSQKTNDGDTARSSHAAKGGESPLGR